MKRLITHHGKFHADDVFCTAWLKKIYGNLEVKRIDRNDIYKYLNDKENFIYDIGNGKYDHHTKECKEYRKNGIPYAAFGKIVRNTYRLIGFDYNTYHNFDECFISPIDYVDNEGPTAAISQHSDVIRAFNQENLYGKEQEDAFNKAVEYADIVLTIMINKYLKDNEIEKITKKIAHKNKEKDIVILDKFYPTNPFKKEGIKFIIYPDLNHWNCNSTDSSIKLISDKATDKLIFRHVSGSFATFQTKAAAVKAAELSLQL